MRIDSAVRSVFRVFINVQQSQFRSKDSLYLKENILGTVALKHS